ncbi:MAG: NAD(+)/NADH kinase [Bacteroidetes bacterium]|nr:NAD(+)/NADH kinase [Bacteroidota bacterium]
MTIGIIPNTTKDDILDVVKLVTEKLGQNSFPFFISDSILKIDSNLGSHFDESVICSHDIIFKESDLIISIGGDGTMLSTAYEARNYNTPLLGLNFGKLGFLAEFELQGIDQLFSDLRAGNYEIEERMSLNAYVNDDKNNILFAINDFVIDKGGWPKMIELVVNVDDDYVTTFMADGIIVATPTGSTGYSLSTGGPIITPTTKAIALSPLAPHTLNIRPLVISSEQKLEILINSQHSSIQVNCDGQRVHYYEPPLKVCIYKSEHPIKLVHAKSTGYFEILRRKLYWGLDVRSQNENNN